MKSPDAIFCSDLHLRDSIPECRTDDYFAAQKEKINFLVQTAKKYNAPIYCAGDIFHKARSSKWLDIFAINSFSSVRLEIIPGNHDLPNHNINMLHDSSLGVLSQADNIICAPIQLDNMSIYNIDGKQIGMIHKLVHNTSPVMAGKDIISYSAKKLLQDFPELDVIITGDNHQSFLFKNDDGRILVNPGSMMRMTAAQTEHKPCFYLYYSDTNTVESCYWPIASGVVSREHREKEQQRDERMESYVERMNNEYELSLSFENNLRAYLANNETRQPVQDIIWEHINE